MRKQKKSIRVLTQKHAGEVHALRAHGFATAQGFIIHPDVSRWSYKDDFYYNIGAFHGSELVSVMRLDWVFDEPTAQYKLNSKSVPLKCDYPAAILVKAATIQGIRGGGLNALLRYWSLKIVEAWNVRHVLGTMVKDSPRVKSMIEMGYDFQTNPDLWRGYYHSDDECIIGILDMQKKRKQTFAYLADLVGDKLEEYKPEFDPRDLKLKPYENNYNMEIKAWLNGNP